MIETGDQRSLTIRTMVTRAQDEFEGFRRSRDYELMSHLMTTAYDSGFVLEHLVQHRHKGMRGYGFFRDKSHIASVVMARGLSSSWGPDRFGVVVTTTGKLAGLWAFMLDDDNSLLISHNGQPCTEVGDLESLELMTAVIAGALTEPLEEPRRGLFRRR
jgi:hypothetical protein